MISFIFPVFHLFTSVFLFLYFASRSKVSRSKTLSTEFSTSCAVLQFSQLDISLFEISSPPVSFRFCELLICFFPTFRSLTFCRLVRFWTFFSPLLLPELFPLLLFVSIFSSLSPTNSLTLILRSSHSQYFFFFLYFVGHGADGIQWAPFSLSVLAIFSPVGSLTILSHRWGSLKNRFFLSLSHSSFKWSFTHDNY